jgi:hypothetical protein
MPRNDREYCTMDTCPVSASIYGYIPSLGWNAFPLAIAAICCVAQLGMGIKFKTWSYMVAVTIGCFLEAIGEFSPYPCYMDHKLLWMGANVPRIRRQDRPSQQRL